MTQFSEQDIRQIVIDVQRGKRTPRNRRPRGLRRGPMGGGSQHVGTFNLQAGTMAALTSSSQQLIDFTGWITQRNAAHQLSFDGATDEITVLLAGDYTMWVDAQISTSGVTDVPTDFELTLQHKPDGGAWTNHPIGHRTTLTIATQVGFLTMMKPLTIGVAATDAKLRLVARRNTSTAGTASIAACYWSLMRHQP